MHKRKGKLETMTIFAKSLEKSFIIYYNIGVFGVNNPCF